jgi:HEAT repeat protein
VAWGAGVDEILKSGELAKSYNPVLLDYLLNEGQASLPDAKRKQAIDQLVSALKTDIEITPEEQKAASLAVAAAGVAQLFGGRDVNELGNVAQDATWQIWNGWIDSAMTLEKAGYRDDAVAFYEKCIRIYPYSDLKGRCAIALAKTNPDEAVARLMEITNEPDSEVVKPALRLLGELAGSEGFPEAKRKEIIARITEFGSGMKKATYGEAVCRGLVATRDPSVVPTLQGLSKGMMNTAFFACSRRGLLMEFGDRSVIPLLEKDLAGGMLSTAKPSDKLFSVRLLVEAGEDSGYKWAADQLTAKEAGGMKKFLKTSSDDFDYKPALVPILASGQKEKSIPVLQKGFDAARGGSWLRTWIAIGMLEMGDTTHVDLVKKSMTVPEWDFTAVRAATALAKNGDFSGISALDPVYARAAAGEEPNPAAEFLSYLSGQGASWEANEEAKRRRSINLRRQIASALGSMNRDDCVPLLEKILSDDEPYVRVGAAYAVTRMTSPAAAGAHAAAVGIDYGSVGEKSRNPLMHARIVRHAGAAFPDDAATKDVVKAASGSPYASVRFLAASLSK